MSADNMRVNDNQLILPFVFSSRVSGGSGGDFLHQTDKLHRNIYWPAYTFSKSIRGPPTSRHHDDMFHFRDSMQQEFFTLNTFETERFEPSSSKSPGAPPELFKGKS